MKSFHIIAFILFTLCVTSTAVLANKVVVIPLGGSTVSPADALYAGVRVSSDGTIRGRFGESVNVSKFSVGEYRVIITGYGCPGSGLKGWPMVSVSREVGVGFQNAKAASCLGGVDGDMTIFVNTFDIAGDPEDTIFNITIYDTLP